jgi:hypothetical protein
MAAEHDLVVLTEDLPEHGLALGDVGTVVLVHGDGDGYEVEFATLLGDTVAVVTLLPGQIRPLGRQEIAHARALVG